MSLKIPAAITSPAGQKLFAALDNGAGDYSKMGDGKISYAEVDEFCSRFPEQGRMLCAKLRELPRAERDTFMQHIDYDARNRHPDLFPAKYWMD